MEKMRKYHQIFRGNKKLAKIGKQFWIFRGINIEKMKKQRGNGEKKKGTIKR